MAKKDTGVWGIDIGHCALKALRCRLEGDQVVADAFDYIEYPKMLNQPEADPAQLVREAITQFLARNDVKGDQVALAVPGQSGLTKFFKPPPVDPKRIANIVKYEARQQIPFSLDEVIWDFQRMAGGMEVEGLLLEAEIGLFAMKRDQVYRAMQPFTDAEVELEIIQLAPLGIYNFVSFDVLSEGPSEEEFDPDDPPESLVVLDMGTDTTDLVITNGFRVWQRSVPVGGNHFTKQLTRSLKLTFAKAEHLKRNARQAKDPKKVFQAMRPVFGDLVTEVQRSIGYFQGIDRKAKIGGLLVLGNAAKLPGIHQYLGKSLGYKMIDFKGFSRLQGSTVLASPAFKENTRAFGVCYGLCLQGLGRARLSTNLVPREIVTDRLVRAKKPWALAAVGALLLACSFNFFFQYRSWYKVQPDFAEGGVTWQDAEKETKDVTAQSASYTAADAEKVSQLERLKAIGKEVGGDVERQLLWLEFLKALNQALPTDPDIKPGEVVDPKTKPFSERKDIHVEYVETAYYDDLATWFTPLVKKRYLEALGQWGGKPQDLPPGGGVLGLETGAGLGGGAPAPAPASAGLVAPAGPASPPGLSPIGPPSGGAPAGAGDLTAAADDDVTGPSGPGWVIEIRGYHFYNRDLRTGGASYVRSTLCRNLVKDVVELPVGANQTMKFTMREMGIGYPILASDEKVDTQYKVPNPNYSGPPPSGTTGAPGAAADADNPPYFVAPRYSFTVQFCWQPQLLTQRLEAHQKASSEQAPSETPPPEQKEAQPAEGSVAVADPSGGP